MWERTSLLKHLGRQTVVLVGDIWHFFWLVWWWGCTETKNISTFLSQLFCTVLHYMSWDTIGTESNWTELNLQSLNVYSLLTSLWDLDGCRTGMCSFCCLAFLFYTQVTLWDVCQRQYSAFLNRLYMPGITVVWTVYVCLEWFYSR